jgi:hypothetical protein
MELDMRIISNASIEMMNEVIRHIYGEGGYCNYTDLKQIIDKDPHHQVNNGIRLGLIEKENSKAYLTEVGKKYEESDNNARLTILREKVLDIKIFNICIKRLRAKKHLKKEKIGEIWEEIKERKYKKKSLNENIRLTIKWLVELNYAEKLKNGNLKWKED